MLKSTLHQALIGLMLLNSALAASPAEQRGKTLALNNCARCHSIDRVSPSPLKIAPPFRTLHERYPVENLAESLAEGIETGHQNMPVYRHVASISRLRENETLSELRVQPVPTFRICPGATSAARLRRQRNSGSAL